MEVQVMKLIGNQASLGNNQQDLPEFQVLPDSDSVSDERQYDQQDAGGCQSQGGHRDGGKTPQQHFAKDGSEPPADHGAHGQEPAQQSRFADLIPTVRISVPAIEQIAD